MKTPIITNEKVTEAIDKGLVQWQSHTLYNRMGLKTDDMKEATSMESRGILSVKDILDKPNSL